MKLEIYQSLHNINQSTLQITTEIDRPQAAGLLKSPLAEIRKLAAEQLCTEINVSAVLGLYTIEQAEASRLEQERLKREKKLQQD